MPYFLRVTNTGYAPNRDYILYGSRFMQKTNVYAVEMLAFAAAGIGVFGLFCLF